MFTKGNIITNYNVDFPKVIKINNYAFDTGIMHYKYECWFGYYDEGHLTFDLVTGVLEEYIWQYSKIEGGKIIETKR